MSRSVPVLSVLCFLLLSGTGAAAERAAVIPEIRTLEQLEAAPACRLETGWEVRLGLAEPGENAGPWKLLYCHARWVRDDREPAMAAGVAARGEPLGPVFYTVGPERERLVQLAMAMQHREAVFCAAVLTAWPGRYPVRVYSPAGRLLATGEVRVAVAAPCFWSAFCGSWQWGEGVGLPEHVVTRQARAAWPGYDGGRAVWVPEGQIRFLRRAAGTPLPGLIPLGEPWDELLGRPAGLRRALREGEAFFPLALSLDDGGFLLRAERTLPGSPDGHVLARWWVDGRPIVPPRAVDEEREELARLVKATREARVAFGLPEHLGECRAGDRIGLQVLYCPTRARRVPAGRHAAEFREKLVAMMEGIDMATVPLLSNRLDFVLTPALRERARRNERLRRPVERGSF